MSHSDSVTIRINSGWNAMKASMPPLSKFNEMDPWTAA